MKDLRRFRYPPDRVLATTKIPTKFELIETSFNSPFTEEEILELVHSEKGKYVFNGKCIRLENCDVDKCQLGMVGFFDFLSTNLTLLPASKNTQSIRLSLFNLFFTDETQHQYEMMLRMRDTVKQYGKLDSFDKVLGINELANIIAISVLLMDRDNNILLIQRGTRVVVSSGNFAVSSAGSLSEEDMEAVNPFLNCATREIKEELNLEVKDLHVTELVISKQKLQPVVLVKGRIDGLFTDVTEYMISAEDFNVENEHAFSVQRGNIVDMLHHYQFTDVAAYQIFRENPVSRLQWYLGTFRKSDIEDNKII